MHQRFLSLVKLLLDTNAPTNKPYARKFIALQDLIDAGGFSEDELSALNAVKSVWSDLDASTRLKATETKRTQRAGKSTKKAKAREEKTPGYDAPTFLVSPPGQVRCTGCKEMCPAFEPRFWWQKNDGSNINHHQTCIPDEHKTLYETLPFYVRWFEERSGGRKPGEG